MDEEASDAAYMPPEDTRWDLIRTVKGEPIDDKIHNAIADGGKVTIVLSLGDVNRLIDAIGQCTWLGNDAVWATVMVENLTKLREDIQANLREGE